MNIHQLAPGVVNQRWSLDVNQSVLAFSPKYMNETEIEGCNWTMHIDRPIFFTGNKNLKKIPSVLIVLHKLPITLFRESNNQSEPANLRWKIRGMAYRQLDTTLCHTTSTRFAFAVVHTKIPFCRRYCKNLLISEPVNLLFSVFIFKILDIKI